MEQYIKKSALVAELEKRIAEGEKVAKELPSSAIMGLVQAYKNTLSFLDTLEVREVEDVNLEKHLKEDIEDVYFDLNGVAVKGATYYLTVEDIKEIAKHFFELGMQQSKNNNNEEKD